MKDKQTVSRALEKVFKGRGRYDKRTVHPVRDWLFGLFVFVMCITVGGAGSALAFMKYYHISVVEAEYTEPIVQYNEKLIAKVLELYGERKADFMALQKAPLPEVVVESKATSTATTTVAATAISKTADTTTESAEATSTASTTENVGE